MVLDPWLQLSVGGGVAGCQPDFFFGTNGTHALPYPLDPGVGTTD